MKKLIIFNSLLFFLFSCAHFTPQDISDQRKWEMIQQIFDKPLNYKDIIKNSGFKFPEDLSKFPIITYGIMDHNGVFLVDLIKSGNKPVYYCDRKYWMGDEHGINIYWHFILFKCSYNNVDFLLQFTWKFEDNEWKYSSLHSEESWTCPKNEDYERKK